MRASSSSCVNLLNLIGLFASVGMTAFGGGVLPHLSLRLLNKQLLSENTFLEALNWAQCSPGCNGTNISSYLGWRLKGAWAALVLTVVLMLPGLIVMFLASNFVDSIPEHRMHQMLQSLVAAIVALTLAMLWKLTKPIRQDWFQIGIIVLTFVLVGVIRLPIPVVLIPMVVVTWYWDRCDRHAD